MAGALGPGFGTPQPSVGTTAPRPAGSGVVTETPTNVYMSPEQQEAARREQARQQAMNAGITLPEQWVYQQPPSLILGGDPNTANQYAQQAQDTGGYAQQYLNQAAQQSQGVGYTFGQNISDAGNRAEQYGTTIGGDVMGYGQAQGQALGGMANQFYGQGGAAQGRSVGVPDFATMNANLGQGTPNFYGSDTSLSNADRYARELTGIEAQEGPSAAQAQLRQGLNAAQSSNIALARSGRGFGGSAGSMFQAQAANAAAGQQAANQSAVLRAQEDAARRQRMAQNLEAGAGISQGISQQQIAQQNLAAQTAIQRAGMNLAQQQLGSDVALQQQAQNDAYQQMLYGLGLQAQTAGAGMGMQGMIAGAGIGQQGIGQNIAAQQGAGETQLAGLGQSGQLANQGAIVGLAGQAQALGAQQQNVSNTLDYLGLQAGIHSGNQASADAAAARRQQESQYKRSRFDQYVAAGANLLGNIAGAISDRDKKKDIEPANEEMLMPSTGDALLERGNPYMIPMQGVGYDPFAQGVGVSGPGQMPGASASAGAAAAASSAARGKKKDDEKSRIAGMLGQGLGQFGGALGQAQAGQVPGYPYGVMSDEREKTGAHRYSMSDEDAKEAIDETHGYSYRYKDPDAQGAGPGRYFGVMAQDLEKTPAGKSTVREVNGTKMVDTSRLTMVNTAALNALSKQVADLSAMVDSYKSKKDKKAA